MESVTASFRLHGGAWLRAALLGGALALFVAAWYWCAPAVPVDDDYDAILRYLVYPAPERWRHILDLHNEHRIGTVRVLAEGLTALLGRFDFRVFIALGNVFMVALAALWYVRFARLRAVHAGAVVVLALLSLLHWANQFNALCAVQNVLAVLLPFVALMALERAGRTALAGTLAAAVLATFTSGSGVLVWPALLFAEWQTRRRAHVLAVLALAAVCVLGVYFALGDTRPPQVVRDVAQPDETLLARTTVMGYTVEVTPMFIVRHLAYATVYFFACAGGIVPVAWLNVAAGVVLVAAAAGLVFTRWHTRVPAMIGMTAYLLACCASCGIFRAAEFTADVPSRYRIVSVSLFAAVLYLVCAQAATADWRARGGRLVQGLAVYGGRITLVLVALGTCAYFISAFPALKARAAAFDADMRAWPAREDAIHYPADRRAHAAAILRESIARGIYTPPAS